MSRGKWMSLSIKWMGGRVRLEIKLTSDSWNLTRRLLRRCATQIRRGEGWEGGEDRRGVNNVYVECSEHERYRYMQIISERVGGEATHTHEQVTGSLHATTKCRTVSSLRSAAVDRLPLHFYHPLFMSVEKYCKANILVLCIEDPTCTF